ncbi:MAG: SMP-30/gluconolactonase/LRE family protein [Planctomycetes bacterium]|nr:SMP-30/gluconolactonase/LRE family protein [Planctomycetota bacterium]
MTLDYHSVPLPAGVIAADVDFEPAATIAFTEGPAAAADGMVYFTDIANDRILRFDPREPGRFTVWRQPSGRANGMVFDPQGRLIVCEGNEWSRDDGGRLISRIAMHTRERTVLTERFDGVRYNAPNDVAAASDGRIYFTDPCYGDRSTMEMEHESVYRVDPDGSVSRVVSQPDIQRPNGIALSPDEKTLYLVDSCPVMGGNRRIWAFDRGKNGGLSNQRLVYDFAPGRGGDGMAVDVEGTLYIAAGIARPRGPHETTDVPPGIWVLTPAGEVRGRIPILEDVLTNVTFGGEDLQTLYVTAGKTLFRVRVGVPGFVVHRRVSHGR